MKKQVFKGDKNENGNVATIEKPASADLKIIGNPEENLSTEETPTEENPAEFPLKPQIEAMIQKFKPDVVLTAEGRIERMKEFEALSKRFETLKEKRNDLKTFKAGNDKMNAKITFKNAQGFNFEVQNSNVIEKLVASAEHELAILLNEAENEVLTYEI